jgi:hypothetical protein
MKGLVHMIVPAKSESGVIQVGDHVEMEWLNNGRMVWVNLQSDKRTAIDEWYQLISQVAQDWVDVKSYLAIYDLSAASLTPYFRKRSLDVANAVTHLQGRYAIVITNNDPISTILRMYFESTISTASVREGRVFQNGDEAEMWLREVL